MSNIYLISKTPVSFDNVIYSDTLKAIDLDKASCIVYHSSNDVARELPLALSSLSDKVTKIIYMNEEIDPLLYCIFMGQDADIYDDESGLEAEETLMFYVENYKETGLTMPPPNTDVDTLMKSLEVFTKGDTDEMNHLITNTYWLNTLKLAASNIDAAVQRSLAVNAEVTRAFSETRSYIDAIVEGQGRTTEQLQRLQETISTMESAIPMPVTARRSDTPSYYPTTPVPAKAVGRTLYIQTLSPCRFLVSFILAFQDWAKASKFKDIRVLVIGANLNLVRKKYEKLPQLGSQGLNFMSLDSSHFVTFDPRKSVLDKFFSIDKADGFIVLDLSYGAGLLSAPRLKKMYATSSPSDLYAYQIKPQEVIFSGGKLQNAICLSPLSEYQKSDKQQRLAKYAAQMSTSFEALLGYIQQ